MNLYQKIIHCNKYARFIPELNRREYWHESVSRYVNYMKKVMKNETEADKEFFDKLFIDMEKMILNQQTMPSMRLFFSAGNAVEKENQMAYNCKFQSMHNLKSFADLLYSLMCTCGVGCSVQRKYIEQLPKIPTYLTRSPYMIVVEDSREGWATALLEFLEAIFYKSELKMFDVSKVRKAGEALKSSGGTASGPVPLLELRMFIDNLVYNKMGQALSSVDVFDIICKIAGCVVAGGLRRSAIITLFDEDDIDMFHAKDPEKLLKNPHRYNSNNTVVCEKPETIYKVLEVAKYNGEPGIMFKYNVDRKMEEIGRKLKRGEWGMNPCVTADTMVLTKDGYKPIIELVDKDVTIWNGFEWSDVKPFATGVNDTLKITFSNGSVVRCTNYHKWVIMNRERVEAKDLKVGDVLCSFALPDLSENLTPKLQEIITVEKIEVGLTENTYCLTEPKNNTFIANGVITGNCAEIILRPNEFCNLGEVVLRPEDDFETDKKKVEMVTFICMMQAKLTNFKFIDKEARENQEDESLLGVSLTGLLDCPNYQNVKNNTEIEKLKQVALDTVDKYWKKFGLKNKPTSVTTIKPSGTVSLLVDSSSGIHARYAKYYLKRMIIGEESELYKFLTDNNVPYIEVPSVNGRIFEFPMKAPDNALTVEDITLDIQLDNVEYGLKKWASHNISSTIYVKPDEWDKFGDRLANSDEFLALSFLPLDVNQDTSGFAYLPLEQITKEEYERRKVIEDKIVWENISKYFTSEIKTDDSEQKRDFACVGGACELI